MENGDTLMDVEVKHDEDAIPMNTTTHYPFLSQLCVDGGLEDALHFQWELTLKKQKPIVGMKFKDPQQLKSMLCNYEVANGCQ